MNVIRRVAFTTVLALVLVQGQSSFAGSGSGNGGDPDELEFVSIGRTLVDILRKEPNTGLPPLLSNDLERVVKETEVRVVESLTVDRTAVNYPDLKVIEVWRSRYQALRSAWDQKASLVFHEYLGILGIDDSRYHYSSAMLGLLARRALETSSKVWSCSGFCSVSKVNGVARPQKQVDAEGPTAAEALRAMNQICERYAQDGSNGSDYSFWVFVPKEHQEVLAVLSLGATVQNACVRN